MQQLYCVSKITVKKKRVPVNSRSIGLCILPWALSEARSRWFELPILRPPTMQQPPSETRSNRAKIQAQRREESVARKERIKMNSRRLFRFPCSCFHHWSRSYLESVLRGTLQDTTIQRHVKLHNRSRQNITKYRVLAALV